jgi:hypothetical protein
MASSQGFSINKSCAALFPPLQGSNANRFSRVALMVLAMLCIGSTGWSQNTAARLSGKITDSTGAVVPHARVTAVEVGTNRSQTVTSDDSGVYTLVALPPGNYTLTTEAPAFSTHVQTGIVLTVAQSATLDIALKPGATQETITVNGGAELINTTTAEISQVIGEESIKDLPLNGRDPSSLVNLSVGVTNELISQASTLPGSNSFPTESGASAGGQRQGSTWYLLDGVANMDTFALLAAPFPNADATQEFRVISNNFDARYGFAPSAVVSIQTKSGTNQFHGGLFEFIRNNDLNASNWFTGAVDPLKRNQFGGDVGGPILKDRLFFFTNYQGTRSNYQASSNPTDTPTQAMLDGDFSGVPTADLNGPLAGVFQIVNGKPNQVSTSLFSPGALAIAKSLPLGVNPATGQTNYAAPAQKFTYNENTSRFDYTINPNQRVFLRSFTYLYNQPGASVPGDILAGVNGQHGTYLNLVGGHTWTLKPTLLNSATLSWAEIDFSTGTIEKDAGGAPICLSRYINVSDPVGECYIGGLSAFDGNVLYGGGLGFNAFTGNPNDTRRRYWWFTDTVTKTMGKHTITAGADLMHRYGFEFYGGSVNAGVSFNGQFTGFPLADFLLGYLSGLSQGAGESGSESGYMIGLYGQDQIKLRPNLTFTAGLRWDPNFPLQVAGGRGAVFAPGEQSTRYPNAPLGLIFPGDHGVHSVVLWSVRVNESRDFHDLYLEANALAHSLDSTRQTTGARYFQQSELLEDVFSMNDFGFPLKEPNHPLYLNTEFVGAEFPVRPWDDNARHREHILRYARIYNQLAGDARYAGGLGWCAFDYQTHADFGAGDQICYHGVMDTFRQPKPAAGFFRSQCSPQEEAVLEPGFHFAENDEPGGFEKEVICSNCDEIQCSIVRGGVAKPVVRLKPARDEFPHLAHPPFFLTLPEGNDDWGDLRLDGYVGGKLVISRTCSGKGIDQKFTAIADDEELVADGSDATRVSLRVTDEYGAIRPLCNDPISITLEGPAVLLGESLVALSGGRTAVWVRASTIPGELVLTARHSHFGERKVTIQSRLGPGPGI